VTRRRVEISRCEMDVLLFRVRSCGSYRGTLWLKRYYVRTNVR